MKGNILKLDNLRKDNGWCDKDQVMLCACFQLLVDFIEKEKPHKIVDYQHDAGQREQWKELQALYRYWKVERPRLEKKKDALLRRWHKDHKTKWVPQPEKGTSKLVVLRTNEGAFRRLRKVEVQFEELEERMLGRLIKARKHLWC